MPGGRPPKYCTQMVEDGYSYIKNFRNFGDMIPSNVGLCRILGVRRATIYAWKDDPEKVAFSDMLDELQETQKRTLLNEGLSGGYNSNIVKLVLAKHGYAEKKENVLSNPDGSPIFGGIKIEMVEAEKRDE